MGRIRGIEHRGQRAEAAADEASTDGAPAGVLPEATASDAFAAYPSGELGICIMSDLHVLAPELWADNDAFAQAENSDRKMFRESLGILKRALSEVVAAKPRLVFVPGDLTKDGELACHKLVRSLFDDARAQLERAGAETSFFVINGNHDLNNHHGLDFTVLSEDGSAQPAERTDPLAYKRLWKDYGYAGAAMYDADGTSDGSLSYAARPFKGLTVIAVDTCRYNEEAADGTAAQTTGGRISERLLSWVCGQAEQARRAGDLVIVLQHHGVVPHFDDEPALMGEYLVEDYESVAQAYAEAGVSVVLTGHMHANDIAHATYGGTDIYDIETGSLVTYPSFMRMGSLSFAQDGAQVTATLSVGVRELGSVAFEGCGLDGQGADDITAYGQSRTLTIPSVQTMLSSLMMEPLLESVSRAGLKPYLAGALSGVVGDGTAEALNPALWSMLTGLGLLPASAEDGVRLACSGFRFSIYCDEETGRINVAAGPASEDSAGVRELSLPADRACAVDELLAAAGDEASTVAAGSTCIYVDADSFSAFLDGLFAELDAHIIAAPGRENTLAVVGRAVEQLLSAAVDAHSLLDLADYCYQEHLRGNEMCEAWAEAAIADVRDEGLLNRAIAVAVNALLRDETMAALAESISLDLKTLFIRGDEGIMGTLLLSAVSSLCQNLSDLLALLTGDEGLPEDGSGLGAMVAFMLPERLFEMAASALYTLSHDSNATDDHALSVKAVLADPAIPHR